VSKADLLNRFVIVLLIFLGLRLFQLQILEHGKYKILAKNNTTRVSIIRAPRGVIYDRHKNILATSKQSLSVIVYPAVLKDPQEKESVAKMLSSFLDMSYADMIKMFTEMDPTTPLPLTIDNNIKVEDAIKIFENHQYLPGISVEKQATRYYPYAEITAHLLGHVGQVSPDELKKRRSQGLILGDVVGKESLEKVYDQDLRGKNGEERVAVDRHGRSLMYGDSQKRVINKAVRGHDLYLTIDADIQKAAYEALKNIHGAAVVINPRSGEILALVSTPSFDPNIFTKPVPAEIYSQLAKEKAFINRALSSFTPGSIWKPITTLAGLEHGVASEDENLQVSGGIYLGGFKFGDWTSAQAVMNLTKALAWSRNTYFYQIGKRMKPEWIADTGKAFGFGRKTNIEIVGEDEGVVPDPIWKKLKMKEPWFPGNTLHLSIGQSFLLVTPLQAARMIATIGMNGLMPKLHVVVNPDKEKPETKVNISQKSLDVVQKGLRMCVAEGTGQTTKFQEFVIAGKTGSAEVRGYSHSTHGWFISYAPAAPGEVPDIAMAIFGEGAGHGGSVCAPVARKIYEVYLAKKQVQVAKSDTHTEEQT
jgi:penicillin-binding protein 2